ncbi:hypothetical protein B551_0222760 [Cupriavidus sp. HPC(L)]|uniref:DUF1799 domain-containing protein n=1 Tax=Cupriavidus sp. HPC(L) TaxID=1217418 RepID=UPI000291A297|nr:DUF1799 domain-containing protein [Cupriavidus sp. HPC(L)]ESH90793.1 hypothetical protein B551_0222760 [Cupriavidus sp. HPC(L)]
MYWRAPPEDELSAFGLKLSDVIPDDIEVWPDNEAAVSIFVQMGTQWRVGVGGPVGLDYSALRFVMRMQRVPPAEQPDLFEDIRVMEHAALDEMSER